jgi:hypothetical protein
MARKVSRDGDGLSPEDEAGSSAGKRRLAVGRRVLLTRGGVVAAGMVGAGALGAAVAGPASAQTTDLELNTANEAGTSSTVTELDADNDTTPAFIIANTGVDSSNNGAGPNLRLTPAAGLSGGPFEPTASTTGGDLTATADGQLWFTHVFIDETTEEAEAPEPAPVHTEATANVFAGLATPVRVLDTRTTAGQLNVLNASGNISSAGLLTGKTIYINLDSLVAFADNVIANFTATQTSASGFLTIYSGVGTRPTTSNINWTTKGVTIANLSACVVGFYPPTATEESEITAGNVIAIYADTTTHVLMDCLAFTMPGFEYATGFSPSATAGTRAARLQKAQKKLLAARTLQTSRSAKSDAERP